MKRIGFNVDEEIQNLDKSKNATSKRESRERQRKFQRLGVEFVEFYLEPPSPSR